MGYQKIVDISSCPSDSVTGYWFPFGFSLVSLWCSFVFFLGFPLLSLWFSFVFSLGFPWFPFAFPLVFLWFPFSSPFNQHREGSPQRKTCPYVQQGAPKLHHEMDVGPPPMPVDFHLGNPHPRVNKQIGCLFCKSTRSEARNLVSPSVWFLSFVLLLVFRRSSGWVSISSNPHVFVHF